MEEFTFQINIMAISLAIIALVAVGFLLAVILFLLSFYFRFANKLDKMLSDVNTISDKCNVLLGLVSDEVSRAKDKMDSVYYSINAISGKILRFSSFIQDFRIPKFVKALFSLFSTKKYNYTNTEPLNTRPIRTKSKKKFNSTIEDDFDF